MLSICIPIYNYDLSPLVNSLHEQGKTLDIPFEIILADDASDNFYRNLNQKLNNLEHVKYIQLEKNIGRAKIRNYLAKKANFPYLLIMDCDSITPDNKFLERYLPFCKNTNIIVCGGTTHYPSPGDNSFLLRWLYGKNREEKTAAQRNQNPNNSFMTNNFLISKKLFEKFRLNEAITGYGHEDTYFGYQLKKAGINIIHIDNPLIHTGLEPADVYVRKTEEAIHNLLKIYEITNYDQEFVNMVSLLKTFRKIKKWRLTYFLQIIFKTFNYKIKNNLLSSNPKLWILYLYKLGYICKAAK